MTKTTEERYKALTLRQRSYIDRKVKARKRRRKALKELIRGLWCGMMLAAFILMLLCMGSIESRPVQNGAIMIGCSIYLAITANATDKWKEEYELKKDSRIIPFPIRRKSGVTKIS